MLSDDDVPEVLRRLATDAGGTINEVHHLPNGSGFATMNYSLPKDHWLTVEGYNVPPMPFRMEGDDLRRHKWAEKIRAAGRYAVRASTMNGKDDDFDPDALVQNFVIGMLGYWTPDGLSQDAWNNPDPIPPMQPGDVGTEEE